MKKVKFITIVFGLFFSSSFLASAQYPSISVTEVDFGWDGYLKYGLINQVIHTPQWTSSGTKKPILALKENYIWCRPNFHLSSPWNGGDGSPVWIEAHSPSRNITLDKITYISNGATEFTIWDPTNQPAKTLTSNAIGSATLTLDWAYSYDGTTYYSCGTTTNFCYVLFNAPENPWSQDGINGIPVYTEVLDYAFYALSGQTSESSALQTLTPAITGWMGYDGGEHFTNPNFINFHIKNFIAQCTPASGPNDCDCRDFANFYKCASAAVGIDTPKIAVEALDSSLQNLFTTHPIKPAKKSPEDNGVSWRFHQFCFTTSTYDYIIDASLLLDSDSSISGWTSPGYLANNNITESNYLYRLSGDWASLQRIYWYDYCGLDEGV